MSAEIYWVPCVLSVAVVSPPYDSLSVAGDEYLNPFGSPVSCSSGQILNFELHNFLPINLEFLTDSNASSGRHSSGGSSDW